MPRDVGVMLRYGSSWAHLRAERMLRLPMTAMPSNAHLLDACGRLNAGDNTAFYWPVLERLTAAKLVSGMSTAAAARGT